MTEKKFIEYAQELYANNEALRKANDILFESRLEYISKSCELQQRIDKYEKVINELREYMLDIDYKMGWQYANKLDELLEGENDERH